MDTKNLSPAFLDGFVKSCMENGLSFNETQSAFKQHSLNYLLSTPHIYRAFQEKLASYRGDLTKSQMAEYLSPRALAIAAEVHVKYASDPLSESLRFELGMPDPSWDNVEPGIRKIASTLSDSLAYYAQLPMNQKVLLASLTGAGIGGLSRLARPSLDDEIGGRGKMERTVRGIGRGALTGAGVGAGSELGEIAGAEAGGAGGVVPGMMTGGMAGGLLTNHLAK